MYMTYIWIVNPLEIMEYELIAFYTYTVLDLQELYIFLICLVYNMWLHI